MPAVSALGELGTDRYGWLHERLDELGVEATYSPELNFLNIRLGEGENNATSRHGATIYR